MLTPTHILRGLRELDKMYCGVWQELGEIRVTVKWRLNEGYNNYCGRG